METDQVKDEGQKCISTVPKARLVARGFKEINTEKLPKDSPTYPNPNLPQNL